MIIANTSEWLEFMARHNETAKVNPYRWLLDNGRRFDWSPLPPRMRRRAPKACFWNSLQLAERGRGRFAYIEGFATAMLPVHHAWCFDRETGRIVDATWVEGSGYVGVPVRTAYVRARLNRGASALLDWLRDFPVEAGAVPRGEWEEPLEARP